MTINSQYAKEIYKEFGYLATWLPTANVQVGDIGIIEDGIFQKTGTLKDLGIIYASQVDPQTGDIEYASANAVSVDVKAAGTAPVSGVNVDASVAVSFARANAILFQASQCRASTISNLSEVANSILSLSREGRWPTKQVVITDVISSAAATVLISSGANAHIDLSVKGNVGAEKAKLASGNATFGVNSFSGIATRIVGEKGSTPLFKASGISQSWLPWRDPQFRTRAVDDVQLVPLTDVALVAPPGERAG
jgi:hypothetical protein